MEIEIYRINKVEQIAFVPELNKETKVILNVKETIITVKNSYSLYEYLKKNSIYTVLSRTTLYDLIARCRLVVDNLCAPNSDEYIKLLFPKYNKNGRIETHEFKDEINYNYEVIDIAYQLGDVFDKIPYDVYTEFYCNIVKD